jgi:threonine/homoserine/homoserine lactone efflux protein
MDAGLWMSVTGPLAVIAVGVASPGPSFLVVSRTAMARSRPAALGAALGVAAGDLAFAALAMSGLSLLLLGIRDLALAVRVSGGLYLLWLGAMAWRGAQAPAIEDDAAAPAGGGFRVGLLTCLTNPQTIAFFVGLFAASTTPDGPGWTRFAVVGGTFLLAAGWYGFVALAFSTPRVRRAYASARAWIDRAFGTLLIALGLRLALAM